MLNKHIDQEARWEKQKSKTPKVECFPEPAGVFARTITMDYTESLPEELVGIENVVNCRSGDIYVSG